MTERKANWNGSKWCRKERRLGLYLRDGMCCLWCGAGVEDEGVTLSLDHVIPDSLGGGNESSNLITSCRKCNSERGAKSVAEFALIMAPRVGKSAREIVEAIRRAVKRQVRTEQAKQILAQRKAERLAA